MLTERTDKPGLVAFMTSGQETEWVYSNKPGSHCQEDHAVMPSHPADNYALGNIKYFVAGMNCSTSTRGSSTNASTKRHHSLCIARLSYSPNLEWVASSEKNGPFSDPQRPNFQKGCWQMFNCHPPRSVCPFLIERT